MEKTPSTSSEGQETAPSSQKTVVKKPKRVAAKRIPKRKKCKATKQKRVRRRKRTVKSVEFVPESDDENEVVPIKYARTARRDEAPVSGVEEVLVKEVACENCGKSDDPERILLCETCNNGYHCACLSPILFHIPEGDWNCHSCEYNKLVAAFEKRLKEYDAIIAQRNKEREEAQKL